MLAMHDGCDSVVDENEADVLKAQTFILCGAFMTGQLARSALGKE